MSSLTLSGGKSQHGYNVAWFDSRYCISGPYCLYYWKIPEELRRGEKNGIMVLGFTCISALSEHSWLEFISGQDNSSKGHISDHRASYGLFAASTTLQTWTQCELASSSSVHYPDEIQKHPPLNINLDRYRSLTAACDYSHHQFNIQALPKTRFLSQALFVVIVAHCVSVFFGSLFFTALVLFTDVLNELVYDGSSWLGITSVPCGFVSTAVWTGIQILFFWLRSRFYLSCQFQAAFTRITNT